MRGRKRPEGEGWLTVKQTARILHRAVRTIITMIHRKQLTSHRCGYCHYLRIEEVEALARHPEWLRRESNHERRMARRKWVATEQVPDDLIDLEAAAWMLGVSRERVKKLVYNGQLISYQKVPEWSPHRFSAAEVETLREARATRRAEREARPKPEAKLRRWTGHRCLSRGGRVEVGDLSEWEKYFGEWLTTRQVAWMLYVTMPSVTALYQNGRLHRERQPTLMTGRMQWHYRKAEVVALMNDPEYNRRRAQYERYVSPEGKARRAAEAYQRQLAEVDEANRHQVAQRHLEEIINSQW